MADNEATFQPVQAAYTGISPSAIQEPASSVRSHTMEIKNKLDFLTENIPTYKTAKLTES